MDDNVIPFGSEPKIFIEDLEEDWEWSTPEEIAARVKELEELEKESTGVEPALCQRIRAEMLSEHLLRLYGIRIGPLDLMTALMYTGVKLSLDSLGHVQSGYNSLKYDPSQEEVPDLKKYRISKRLDS